MKYICRNKECSHFNVEDEYVKESYVYSSSKDGLVGKHRICPHCGMEREEINPSEQIPLSEKNISFNFFNGMSREKQQEMLKKRSHEHFKKEIKERKDGLLNQAMSEMRGMKKR